ncbi:TlpA family protein disulfide reductase [Massiliimalia massiliensis]|uniref:TlpA family protein disulfide reductase n=1 Tax=Massiliimalia massiliensis TaxID=1852384 RepID=UPI00098727E6|nr:TlpA disulfide reductase family protein [Massiliimalia massiliensis]
MKKKVTILAALTAIMLLFSSCGGSAANKTETKAALLSSFTAKDLEGNTVSQDILSGYDLTMVNVWATFCGPCIQEMPGLGELAGEYQGKGVQIIGLVSDTLQSDGSLDSGQVETARQIVSSTGADYLHLLPSGDLLGILSQISAVPTTFFVDSEGNQVGSAFSGSLSKEKWVSILDERLAEVKS